jgi:hypothetical protein
MIGIQLDGDTEYLDTPEDIAIQIRLENPIFGDAETLSPGSFSYPFNLPAGDVSPKNAQRLKNPDVIENNESYALKKASLFFDGVPLKKGNLTSDNTVGLAKVSSYFTFGLSAINGDIKTARLRDVLTDNYVIAATSITKKVYVRRTDSSDIVITLNGSSYTFPNTLIGVVDLNVATAAAMHTLTLDDPNAWAPVAEPYSGSSPNGIPGVPSTSFRVLLKQSYTVSPGVFADRIATDPMLPLSVQVDQPSNYQFDVDLGTYYSEFQTFLMPYLNELAYPDNKIRFPVVFNAKAYDENLKDGEGVNLVNSAGFVQNDPNWGLFSGNPGQIKNYNSIQPFVLLKYVLDQIAIRFGFTWEGDFYDDAELANILIWNTSPLDDPKDFLGEKQFVYWKRSFAVKDLVPDMNVVDFLKGIASRYNLAVYQNEVTNNVRICYRESISKSINYEDITDKSSNIKSNDNLRADGYTLLVAKDDTDALSVIESQLIGTASTKTIPISCGRLFGSGSASVQSQLQTGPRVSQLNGADVALRIFHYTGIVDKGVYKYASASISAGAMDETLSGIYNSNYKIWLFHLLRRLNVHIEATFELVDILKIDWELKRRFDRSNYILKAIDFTLTTRGLTKCLVEIYNS